MNETKKGSRWASFFLVIQNRISAVQASHYLDLRFAHVDTL
jgi:hypothetical protein